MRVVVVGAGVCGLGAALMLHRDGHEVTVLERDPAPVPDGCGEAWERWERGGVAQFRQAHYLQPLGRAVLDEELPDVRDALVAAGAARFDPLMMMPPPLAEQGPRPGDERFATITARRPVIEHAFARIAEEQIGTRRGVAVERLEADRNGATRITGVRTTAGETLPADLVVDAMGRRSKLPAWLADAGAPEVHEESEDSGYLYYTRFFRGDAMPAMRAPLQMPIGTFSILTLPGDDNTWSVTVYASAGDRPLKRLRDAEAWTRVLQACPLHVQWIEGEPITGVLPMGGIVDRRRRLDGAAAGVALLADACACTNPSLGRGMALGLRHAQVLRDTLREHEDPDGFARAWDEATERELTPWYHATVQLDRDRLREIDALRTGGERPQPADRAAAVRAAIMPAAVRDPDVFRVMLAQRCCLGSPAVLDEPELAERVLELARDAEPPPLAGPDREALLSLLA
jgi:2-polyprenyl-6-methoxyphenol hydroxylase-like FAD-dependent oxidoreductase